MTNSTEEETRDRNLETVARFINRSKPSTFIQPSKNCPVAAPRTHLGDAPRDRDHGKDQLCRRGMPQAAGSYIGKLRRSFPDLIFWKDGPPQGEPN